jgi:AcrR family transcriptional regulator
MRDHRQAPPGLGRRARRLSDQETERRMLAAAVAMVHRTGLTVSLDHISFEDVIRDADVARSAVYRRWPYKDLFFSDLVKELAKEAIPPALLDDEYELIRRVVAGHLDWLDTPELRASLVSELFRQAALLDFEAFCRSPEWRTYFALRATFMSLADGELRDQVQAALARSEQARLARIVRGWQQLAGLLGYRVRPEAGATLDTVVTLIDATMQGIVIMALAIPGMATHRTIAAPFGAAAPEEWSLPALGTASIAAAFLEPDPAIEWDSERIARVRQALTEIRAAEA